MQNAQQNAGQTNGVEVTIRLTREQYERLVVAYCESGSAACCFEADQITAISGHRDVEGCMIMDNLELSLYGTVTCRGADA